MLEIPFDKFLRSKSFRSAASKGDYGSYHHQYIQIVVDSSLDEILNADAIKDFIVKHPQPAEQLHAALRNAAIFHEYKHFYDCFGTIAGISLFGTYLIELKEFLSVCSYLDTKGLTWQLPIWEWINKNDCPDPVLAFAISYRQRVLYREIFMGELELPPEPGITDEIWRDCKVPQMEIVFPIYPLKSKVIVKKGGEIIQQDLATIWHSIGFETIIEGSAQALQRNILAALWPDEIVKLTWEKMTQAETRLDDFPEGNFLGHHNLNFPTQYNVTDYLVTKFFAQTYGIKQFPRSLILQISDIALMESFFPDNKKPLKRHPGDAFTNVIKTTQWTEPIDNCIRKHLIPDSNLINLIDKLSQVRRPEILFSQTRNPSLEDAIAIIESYVQHDIVIPLLKYRLEHGHKAFYDLETFANKFQLFPKPLVTVLNGQIQHFLPDEKTFLLETWAVFVMIRNIFEQIMSGNTVIYCPRAYKAIAGISRVEFAESGSCNNNISRRMCLVWAPGRELSSQLPNCLFSVMIRRLRLA